MFDTGETDEAILAYRKAIKLKADYFKLLSDAAKDDGPSTTIGVSGKLRTAYYVVMSELKAIFQSLSSSHMCLCFLHLST